jgi:hypothetical protein
MLVREKAYKRVRSRLMAILQTIDSNSSVTLTTNGVLSSPRTMTTTITPEQSQGDRYRGAVVEVSLSLHTHPYRTATYAYIG